MSDLDQLLDPTVGDAAREAARLPDFEGLRSRGVRRHRTRLALSGAAVALSVAAGTALVSGLPTEPAPPFATPGAESPDDLVDAPDATPRAVVSPDDQTLRAVQWARCGEADCSSSVSAIVVTDDGFRTRHLVDGVGELRYVGERTFALEPADPGDPTFLVHPDGTTTRVVVQPLPDGQENVIAPAGSVLVRTGDEPEDWAAVDPQTGIGHPQGVPAGLRSAHVAADGTIQGLDVQYDVTRFVSSRNAGESWHETTVARTTGELFTLAPGDGQQVAILVGTDASSDDGTLTRVLRSSDGGRTFTTVPVERELSQLAEAGVLPDGRLLLDVPTGFFLLDGSTWSPASFHQPFDNPGQHVSLVPGPHGTILVGHLDTTSYRSDDGGNTWQPLKLR